jgi:hypothetical protein
MLVQVRGRLHPERLDRDLSFRWKNLDISYCSIASTETMDPCGE